MAAMLILMIIAIGIDGFNTSIVDWIIMILLLLGLYIKKIGSSTLRQGIF